MTEDSSDSPFVRHRMLLLGLLGALLYLPFLGLRDLWYADEPDIAEVCRTMFVSGDWIVPRRLGEIWVDYPPMLYWAGSAASHLLGGISEYALRLPNALASIGMVLVTCAAGSRWYNPRTGLWAGFMLLTCLQFAHQAISYRPDVLFSLMIAGGTLTYAAGAGGRPRLLLRVAGFALLGGAMLAKGPLGLLLPGLVLTLWHGSRREWRRLFELAPLSLAALAVYLPWFIACGIAMGTDNMAYEFYAQNIARFFGGERGHARPVYYYVVQGALDFAPWSLMLPFALAWIHRARLWRDRNVQLALWWFGAFFVFLSLAVTKRQIYLLPAYPAAALLMAPWLAGVGLRSGGPDSRPLRGYLIVVTIAATVVGLGLFGIVVWQDTIVERLEANASEIAVAAALGAPLVAIGAGFLLAAVVIGQSVREGKLRAGLVRLGLVQIPFYLLLSGWLMPAMNPIKTYRPESRWIREAIGDATHVGLVAPSGRYYGKAGALGYYSEAILEYLEGADEIEEFLGRHPGSVVLVYEARMDETFGKDEADWRKRVVRELDALGDLYVVVGASVPRP